MNWVLDASVAASWVLADAGAEQAYATAALRSLGEPGVQALVPAIWGLEVGNVILKAERRGALGADRSERFLRTLSVLPIVVGGSTGIQALGDALTYARHHRLSSYDASYLELARRFSLPLATLDADLRRAARKAGVRIFKP